MIQTLSTLLFLLAAAVGVAVIAASLIDDWALIMRALGFSGQVRIAPLLPHVRALALRPAPVVRVTRRPADRRVAA